MRYRYETKKVAGKDNHINTATDVYYTVNLTGEKRISSVRFEEGEIMAVEILTGLHSNDTFKTEKKDAAERVAKYARGVVWKHAYRETTMEYIEEMGNNNDTK